MSKKKEEKKSINDMIIEEAVKQFKEGKIQNSLDVENYLDGLLQPLMQKLLDAELDNHLEYSKYEHKKDEKKNFRNGYCKPKTVKTKYGNILVKTPRDRNATFEPKIIEKGQTKLTGFEEKCIALYAKGVSLRDIEQTLKDIYGVKINKDDISRLIFTDRGIEDILYMCSDGVAGFKGSLERVFPKAQSQRCVVHLARNIYGLCPKKEAKEIIGNFKKIYQSSNMYEAKIQLEFFQKEYGEKQKRIVKKVEEFMVYLEPLFELPVEIRKCIYTTNAIESVNSALRKVTRGKGAFPSENSVYKVMYLRIKELSEKWKKPMKNWKTIREQLISLFGERYLKYVNL
jgi:transposase-like protein